MMDKLDNGQSYYKSHTVDYNWAYQHLLCNPNKPAVEGMEYLKELQAIEEQLDFHSIEYLKVSKMEIQVTQE